MKHYLYLHWLSARTSLVKIFKQPFSSLLNLIMLSIALALPLTLYLSVLSIHEWSGKLSVVPEISIYMNVSADPKDITTVQQILEKHPKIESVEYINKDVALADLEERNALQGLTDGLETNPLPDAFVVTPTIIEPEALARLKTELSGLPMVDKVQYDAAWATRLYNLIQLGTQLTFFLAAVFAVALVLVVYNTIRMQILARGEEIEVSKLIGATDNFIRRPFLYHAFWQGLFAALIAWGLTSWLVYVTAPVLSDFAKLYNESFELRGLNPIELAALIGITIFLATTGARLAANQHLRKIRY